MKEQKLVELVNKVNGLENIVKQLITELYNLKRFKCRHTRGS